MSWVLLAQAATLPELPTSLLGAFIAVVMSLAILVGWLMRHVFLVTLPSLLAENKAQREDHQKAMDAKNATHEKVIIGLLADNKEQRTSNEKIVGEICTTFKITNDEERKLCAGQFAIVNTALTGLTTSNTQTKIAIVAELSQKLVEEVARYRHELRNDMQAAVWDRDLFAEKKKREALEEEQRQSREAGQRRGVIGGGS